MKLTYKPSIFGIIYTLIKVSWIAYIVISLDVFYGSLIIILIFSIVFYSNSLDFNMFEVDLNSKSIIIENQLFKNRIYKHEFEDVKSILFTQRTGFVTPKIILFFRDKTKKHYTFVFTQKQINDFVVCLKELGYKVDFEKLR